MGERAGGRAGAGGGRTGAEAGGDGGKAGERADGRTVAGGGGKTGEEGFWENYLDLRKDYGGIKRGLAAEDEVMARAVRCGQGIRILNQDPWETLISFIISQNNHIPRIRGCIESLCANFGRVLAGKDGESRRAFPDIGVLAALSAEDLAPCGLGYRAEYIVRAARRTAEAGGRQWLESLRGVELRRAEEELLKIHGVGPKVAACVLLFGLGKTEAFPVDVWVRRAMRDLYGVDERNGAAARDYAAARFGRHAGLAQQYLFYYMKHMREGAPC
jgi:N-glycosylase/DNA lyase